MTLIYLQKMVSILKDWAKQILQRMNTVKRQGTTKAKVMPSDFGWGLFYGMERNDGLNCGTERFFNLKLAGYHCLLVIPHRLLAVHPVSD